MIKGRTRFYGLSTPGLLDLALWVNEKSDPGRPVQMTGVGLASIRQIESLTECQIVTSQVCGRDAAVQITPPGRTMLELNIPCWMYAALAGPLRLSGLRYVVDYPGCTSEDLAHIAGPSATRAAANIQPLVTAGLITTAPGADRKRPKLFASELGARMLVAAGYPPLRNLWTAAA